MLASSPRCCAAICRVPVCLHAPDGRVHHLTPARGGEPRRLRPRTRSPRASSKPARRRRSPPVDVGPSPQHAPLRARASPPAIEGHRLAKPPHPRAGKPSRSRTYQPRRTTTSPWTAHRAGSSAELTRCVQVRSRGGAVTQQPPSRTSEDPDIRRPSPSWFLLPLDLPAVLARAILPLVRRSTRHDRSACLPFRGEGAGAASIPQRGHRSRPVRATRRTITSVYLRPSAVSSNAPHRRRAVTAPTPLAPLGTPTCPAFPGFSHDAPTSPDSSSLTALRALV
jgi:hypothetical protein